MFYKIFKNTRKILLYLLKLKSISEKREKQNHALMLKSSNVFRFIYEHIQIDL